jgi:hypothetical protein
MNSYLNGHLNQDHRAGLAVEAASNRLASVPALPEPRREGGIRAAIRRLLAAPEADSTSFMPRLVDYPTARH